MWEWGRGSVQGGMRHARGGGREKGRWNDMRGRLRMKAALGCENETNGGKGGSGHKPCTGTSWVCFRGNASFVCSAGQRYSGCRKEGVERAGGRPKAGPCLDELPPQPQVEGGGFNESQLACLRACCRQATGPRINVLSSIKAGWDWQRGLGMAHGLGAVSSQQQRKRGV